MALVTSAVLLSRLRQATDTEGDAHLTDAELYRQLTSAVAETWDYILAHGLGSEGVKSVTFNTVANQQEYAITSVVPALDFYQVKTLYVVEANGQLRPISRVNPNEEHGLKAPTGVYAMKLYYVPTAPTWSTGTESFDGINGWEEHTVQTAAIFVRNKKSDDAGPHIRRKNDIEARIKVMANRNQDDPPRVVRRAHTKKMTALFAPFSPNVTAWDIRGANLELFYAAGVYY